VSCPRPVAFASCAAIAWMILTSPPARPADLRLPDWVDIAWVTEAERAFPEADEVDLLRSFDVRPDGSSRLQLTEQTVTYVRRGDGDDRAIVQMVESPFRRLESMRVWRSDAGGRVSLFDSPVTTQFGGGALYTDSKERTIAIPGIAAGALVVSEIRTTETDRPFPVDLALVRNGRCPVLRFRYRFQASRETKCDGFWVDPATDSVSTAVPATFDDEGRSWERGRIDSFGKPEPMQPAEGALDPIFLLRWSAGDGKTPMRWTDVANWYLPYSQSALEGRDKVCATAERLVDRATSFDEKVRRISDYVRTSVGYVQIYLQDGGIRPHPVEAIHENRFGDCKDMAHLEIALLSCVGITSHPVLVSTRRVALTGFPTPTAFDHVIVGVERGTDPADLLFIDPTEKEVPCGRLSEGDAGAPALVIESSADTGLIFLPTGSPNMNSSRVQIEMWIRPGLVSKARFTIRSTGQLAYDRRAGLRDLTQDDLRRRLEHSLVGGFAGAVLDSCVVRGADTVSDSLTIEGVASIPEPGRSVGDLYLIQPDFISSMNARLFPDPTRRRPIRIGYPRRYETEVRLFYPEEWNPRDPPKDASIENSFGRYSRRVKVSAPGEIRITRVMEIGRRDTPAAEYSTVREWDRVSSESDRARIVLALP